MKLQRLMLTVIVISVAIIFSATSGYCGTPLEKQKTAQGIEYISGGVSIDERDAIKALEKGYNLKVVFAHTRGEYLSLVAVRIKNSAGNLLLDTKTDGPWLLVKLPTGTYSVAAAHDGKEQKRSVTVGSSLTNMLFHWAKEN